MESFVIKEISIHDLIINIVCKHCSKEIQNQHLSYHTDTGNIPHKVNNLCRHMGSN